MGQADSKPAGPARASRALKYGNPGEMGPILGAAYCRAGANAETPPTLVAASADAVSGYNGLTADRKLRVRRKVPLTCVDFKPDTTFGFIALAGTSDGCVLLLDCLRLA